MQRCAVDVAQHSQRAQYPRQARACPPRRDDLHRSEGDGLKVVVVDPPGYDENIGRGVISYTGQYYALFMHARRDMYGVNRKV